MVKTIIVLTPDNVEIEYRLAGAGSRLAAFVIDLLLQLIACLLLATIVLFGISGYRFASLAYVSGFPLAFTLIACFAIYLGYFVVCEMTMNGQSLGKRLFGLRVMRDNGQPIGLVQSIIRNLFRLALDMLYIGLFVILFDKKNKRVGDMAAGTVVVSEHYGPYNGNLSLPAWETAARNPLAARYTHICLSEAERDIIGRYLRRKDSLPDNGAALREKLAAYLAAKWKVTPDWFTDAVLLKLSRIGA